MSDRIQETDSEAQRRRRLGLLIARLPDRLQRATRWLLAPGRAWLRIPAGILFLLGGCLAFLPVLGLWMLPLGFFLLSEDIPFLRRLSGRILAWMEARHPGWLGLSGS
ncbi:hypothetical protein [Swaminathania salitolerans]|uniref:Uncharacterized protein n=1 Tax=Swaminathania salitolerans TaxID=182838 RepID=A0A511BRL2_9PROT|nr:hypothetical protein [Swaminathania salitolerans]GBQ14284.1 hypothetical protein AA21291_1784 [Swaminathania salitolerans LMG 21291]GEL02976.1 hypothetical protein SSA02_21390 [Swaminathania salitolerans]